MQSLVGQANCSHVLLQNLFGAFQIVGIEELSLGANFMASHVKRLRWRTESGLTPEEIGNGETGWHL